MTDDEQQHQPDREETKELENIEETAHKPSKPSKKVKKHQSLHDSLSMLAIICSAVVLAFGLINFVFQSYQVSGPSMQTTLYTNDHLIIWKVGRSLAKLTGHDYIPNRGDVIVFDEPKLITSAHPNGEQLIKRVIGLPGEHITVKDGVATVYNKEHPNGFQPDKTLPYGNVITSTSGDVDITLPKSQVFVMGDNRSNSVDSRYPEVGPVDANRIVGKLVVRVLPLNQAKRF